ncbi:MAG: beta-Ala-His dipeptidase, partial [Clostridia bacterium]|nr:beta-Ala-His dipeptidase [Clostridia bacterium]
MNVCELKPEKVFKFFELISSVPHGSDNTDQISALCCKFAAERGLDYIQDEVGNVIIRKSPTPGYETHQAVILQGHMDMVAVKTPESDIDLERDGLRLKTDGEYLWADGTSLGADDGIAVAMIMALMDSDDIPHPPIEAIITINEETGMDGAVFLDTSVLKGRRMINIDSEDEGIITVGCAGGARVYGQFELKRTEGEYLTAKLTVSGLTGGHSGSEIQKGRANSNKLMGELLHELCALQNVHLVSLDGGEKDNAIANHSEAVIAFPADEAELVRHIAEAQGELIKLRIANTDPNAYVSFEILGSGVISVADDESAASVISAMCRVPDGVQTMSADIEGLVETS